MFAFPRGGREAHLLPSAYTVTLSLPLTNSRMRLHSALKHWKELNNFLLDGRLELSNNRAEHSIKQFVIGRKNFLFCITPRGAGASATTYSIVESVKENGLKPFCYLSFSFSLF